MQSLVGISSLLHLEDFPLITSMYITKKVVISAAPYLECKVNIWTN